MVSKDKLKIILFFVSCFVILSFIVLFPNRVDSETLRKQHFTELQKTLNKYADENNSEWQNFKNKPIKIVFWHNLEPYENKDILDDIIKRFNDAYPFIEIKAEFKGNWGSLMKNINAALPANNEPHLIVSYADFLVNYYESGKLVPLNEFINSKNENIKLKSYNVGSDSGLYFYKSFEDESQLALGEDSKKWYSLPFLKSIELMYYNQTYFKNLKERLKVSKISIDKNFKDCFKEYDNDYFNGELKDDITWEELKIICLITKQVDPQKIPICYDSESNLFIVASEQRSVPYTATKNPSNSQVGVLFNNPEAKTMIKDFKEFYDNKYLITRKLSGETYTTSLFVNEDILMNISSSTNYPYLNKTKFNVGVTSVPYWQPNSKEVVVGKKKVLQQGANLNLFYKKDKDEVLASWLFLRHLVSEDIDKLLLEKANKFPIIPCNTEAVKKQIEELQKNKNNEDSLKLKLLEFMKSEREKDSLQNIYFFSPIFQKSQISRIVVEQLVVDCFINENLKKNIDVLFEEAQQKAQS